MAVGKEIKDKLRSVESTKKITKAMELIAATRLKGAQERMNAARPYAEKIVAVIRDLRHAHPEIRHPFMETSKGGRPAVLLITTDRGLCGGLNTNLFRRSLAELKALRDAGREPLMFVSGNKGLAFCKLHGFEVATSINHLGDRPDPAVVVGLAQKAMAAFDDGKVDQIVFVGNHFVSATTQRPFFATIVPATQLDDGKGHRWDFLYEPDAERVLDVVLRRYVEAVFYAGQIENVACEMAARMLAMKNATDNANGMIKELKLAYNKSRQAAITQEIAEIVSGAAAV